MKRISIGIGNTGPVITWYQIDTKFAVSPTPKRHQIGSDFAFCAGAKFLSRGCEPEVEGRRRQRLSSEITARKSATVHLVCVIIMYTIYEMYKDVASSSHLSQMPRQFGVAGDVKRSTGAGFSV